MRSAACLRQPVVQRMSSSDMAVLDSRFPDAACRQRSTRACMAASRTLQAAVTQWMLQAAVARHERSFSVMADSMRVPCEGRCCCLLIAANQPPAERGHLVGVMSFICHGVPVSRSAGGQEATVLLSTGGGALAANVSTFVCGVVLHALQEDRACSHACFRLLKLTVMRASLVHYGQERHQCLQYRPSHMSLRLDHAAWLHRSASAVQAACGRCS
jgi:hypothetical protein